jgi:hypothetical protein
MGQLYNKYQMIIQYVLKTQERGQVHFPHA